MIFSDLASPAEASIRTPSLPALRAGGKPVAALGSSPRHAFEDHALADLPKRRESIQRPIAHFADRARQKSDTGEQRQATHGLFHEPKLGAQSGTQNCRRV